MSQDELKTERVIELSGYWPYQITVLADRVARRTSKVVKDEGGINLSQWRVMAAIAEVPGRTSVEVVTITPMDKGIVSRATKALLELGLVVRKASQMDGRVSHLYLTDSGRDLYQRILPLVEEVLLCTDEVLSAEEQENLCSHLNQLMKVLPDLR
jgi:DNA-binding MarR family transcriptional regulator